jgi:hypothetical protein
MPNTAQISVNITDLSFSVAQIAKGIAFFHGVTKRGPVSKPDTIIRNWPQFQRLYGGFDSNSFDFALQCKRALDKGTALRIGRVVNYTTSPTDPEDYTAVKGSIFEHVIITFNALLVTGNTYDLTIDGVAITQVPFATSHSVTMATIAAMIQSHPSVASAQVIQPDEDSILIIPASANLVLTTGPNNAGVVAGGASQAIVDKVESTGIVTITGINVFNLVPKYPGLDYNNLRVVVSNASNGDANYFNLAINHLLEPTYNELYPNLQVANTNEVDSTFLSDVASGSGWMDVVYQDLSAQTTQLRPLNGTYAVQGGTDGSTIVIADYTGTPAALNGLHAFDPYSDALVVSAPNISQDVYLEAGANYAHNRKDIQFFGHLANTLMTEAQLTAFRDTLAIDTPYASLFAGGLKVTHPITGQPLSISEIADVTNLATKAENVIGAWRSFAGLENGVISGVTGVVNNFGGNGQLASLDALANRQINMVVDKMGMTLLWDCYSAQKSFSKLSQNGVVRLLIHIQKSIEPNLNRYLQQPNDFISWRELYNEVKPFFDNLASANARALYSYNWRGDQDKNSLADLEVNNATDVGLGKYKVELDLDIISAMVKITLNINVTPSGFSITLQ